MSFEVRENTGSLFKNKNKTPEDSKPDYTGNCLIAGKKTQISAWLKTSAKGEKYMSLKFTAQDEKT